MWMIIYLVNANDEITTNKMVLKLGLTDFRNAQEKDTHVQVPTQLTTSALLGFC